MCTRHTFGAKIFDVPENLIARSFSKRNCALTLNVGHPEARAGSSSSHIRLRHRCRLYEGCQAKKKENPKEKHRVGRMKRTRVMWRCGLPGRCVLNDRCVFLGSGCCDSNESLIAVVAFALSGCSCPLKCFKVTYDVNGSGKRLAKLWSHSPRIEL